MAVLLQPSLAARKKTVDHSRVRLVAVLLELIADSGHLCSRSGLAASLLRARSHLGVENVAVYTPAEHGAQAVPGGAHRTRVSVERLGAAAPQLRESALRAAVGGDFDAADTREPPLPALARPLAKALAAVLTLGGGVPSRLLASHKALCGALHFLHT